MLTGSDGSAAELKVTALSGAWRGNARQAPAAVRRVDGIEGSSEGSACSYASGLVTGFARAGLSIFVNDREVYQKSGLTTDLRISMADQVDVPVEGTTVGLAVVVGGVGRAERTIDVQGTPFVDVAVDGGVVGMRAMREELPML